jgi:hypothetical protein
MLELSDICQRDQSGKRHVRLQRRAEVETRTYTAVCRRTGRWWAVAVAELEGVFTQARCLDQVEQVTRDTIARIVGVDAEGIEVLVRPELPGTVSEALQARHVARLSHEAAEQATASAVHALLRDGCTIRDAALLLGLSSEEISQVAPGTAAGNGETDANGPTAPPSLQGRRAGSGMR